ncbi:P-loop ATPase, Sll1717 family [Pseudomonas sp. YQ_13]|uniref:P-loop ATPase, Sll1717 family n=1 Tax=Pseudomonas sp. YQ_13 TaxID=3367235 RepID=UPI00370B16F2
MNIAKSLGLKGNPFEHYNAEKEPEIAAYAVRPPYLQTIAQRSLGLSSFILFGDRGAGKSATRLTVYKEAWEAASQNQEQGQVQPFIVNLTDFAQILPKFKRRQLSDKDICSLAGFFIIEQLLAWLSSLEDADRQSYLDDLDKNDKALILALLEAVYLSVPEMDRETSTSEAFILLGSAWTTQSRIWIRKRWGSVSAVFSGLLQAFMKNKVDENLDIREPTERILASLVGDSANTAKAILTKLVELCRIFGFSGVCVLVDKLDETSETNNSVEATARLLHPLLANIQLLEVDGFSWMFFVWGNVEDHFNDKLKIRLDKIANAKITWTAEQLQQMLNRRIEFFSNNTIDFSGIFEDGIDPKQVFTEFSTLSLSSPRELIRLMDTLFREHDARGEEAPSKIDMISVELAQDKYAKETIQTWHKKETLHQIYRLGKTTFLNKDVQTTFRIGAQGARNKITKWTDVGLARQSGSVPGESGGKPSFLYEVYDPRVVRIIERRLDELVGASLETNLNVPDEDYIANDSESEEAVAL